MSIISNVKISKLLNDKLSLDLLLSISLINFVFAIRFNGESRIKCGFIVQYESIFRTYLQKVSCKEQDTLLRIFLDRILVLDLCLSRNLSQENC